MFNLNNRNFPASSLSGDALYVAAESHSAVSRTVTDASDAQLLGLRERVSLLFSLIAEMFSSGVVPSLDRWKVVWTGIGQNTRVHLPTAPSVPDGPTSHPAAAPQATQPASVIPSVAHAPLTWAERVKILAGRKPQSLLEKTPKEPTKHSCVEMYDHPEITECHCRSDVSRLDQLNNQRFFLESKLIKEIQSQFPNPKEKEICILSVGSGGLFQEMVIHSRLVTLGYRVHWIFNDTVYADRQGEVDSKECMDPEQHPAIRTFRELAAETGSRVTVVADEIQTLWKPSSATVATLKANPPDVTLMVHSELYRTYIPLSKKDVQVMGDEGYGCERVKPDPDPQNEKLVHIQIYDLIRYNIRRLSSTPQIFALLDGPPEGHKARVDTLLPLSEKSGNSL